MKTSELLAKLRALNVKLWAEGEELGISAPKGALTPELVGHIRARKSELLAMLARREATPVADASAPIVRAKHGEERPLSFSQKRLWFLAQLEPDTATYNMPLAWTVRGPLDVALLGRALDVVVERHEVLRARFLDRRGTPALVIDPPGSIALEVVDATDGAVDRAARVAAVRAELSERAREPFDLARGALLRPALLKVTEDEHVLFLLVHHIVFDGWSAEVLLRELAAVYEALVAGGEPSLAELPIQYADFAAWQLGFLKSAALEAQLRFHSGVLEGRTPLLDLPADHPRPAIQTYRGANAKRLLAPELATALRALARAEGATLYMVLLAAYEVLLARWSGQREFAVGTIVAGRTKRETEGVVGFFANTLVLPCDVSGEPTFRELLARVRETTLGAFEHQDAPFEKLVEELAPERSLAHTPLFQTIFMTESEQGKRQRMGSLELDLFELDAHVARTDLMLTVHEGDGTLEAWVEYSTDLFEEATVQRMLGAYEALLAAIVHDPGASIASLPMLSDEELRALVAQGTGPDVPRSEAPIHVQFERQADRTPDAPAVLFPTDVDDAALDDVLSYAELERRANRLANHLIVNGVVRGELVGIALDRSVDMVVALLAVSKTGAAYVPLDPAYPADRIAYMVEDARLARCITTSDLRALLPGEVTAIELDTEADAIAAASGARPDAGAARSDRMYVIYTSGSTGRPKGVELEHASVANFLASMAREPGFAAGERLLAVTTLSFDISVLELTLPLVTGGTVIVASREATLDGRALRALLERLDPDVMQATPATWRLLVMSGWEGSDRLRVFSGGEALTRELADELLPRCASLWNLYGPTETTIWSTVARVDAGERAPTIGKPIAATRVYVLDDARELVPVGVPGELWIAGDGLARGYLGRPELTEERFSPDPIVGGAGGGARMYRTGDKARWLANGELECLGRVDDQVKLRGFRIELGEIEAVLADVEAVRQCVCVVREDRPGDQRLTAFLTTYGAAESAPSDGELRETALAKLPAYMVPAAFVRLDAFPQTPNGKVDRKVLRSIPLERRAVEEDHVAPKTDTERALAEIWAHVLEVERVAADASFFELGGHSLLLAEVAGRIEEAFGVRVSIIELFQYPTIASLAAHVDATGDEDGGDDGGRGRDLAAGRQALSQRRRIRR